jgi:hypothetical protein
MKRDELLIAAAALMGFEFPIETSVALPHALACQRADLFKKSFEKCAQLQRLSRFPVGRERNNSVIDEIDMPVVTISSASSPLSPFAPCGPLMASPR